MWCCLIIGTHPIWMIMLCVCNALYKLLLCCARQDVRSTSVVYCIKNIKWFEHQLFSKSSLFYHIHPWTKFCLIFARWLSENYTCNISCQNSRVLVIRLYSDFEIYRYSKRLLEWSMILHAVSSDLLEIAGGFCGYYRYALEGLSAT